MTIYPTHTCFDDALENLLFLMKRDGQDIVRYGKILIVHAIIHPAEVPEALANAWVESLTSVYFSGLMNDERVLVEADRREYYTNSNVKKAVRYTLFEAYTEELRRGHFGPWDDEIRTLCNRDLTFRPSEQDRKE